LHGELKKVRSTLDENLVYELDGWELRKGDLCEKGSQLRPHIVWFGEAVTMIEPAIALSAEADIFIVIGTSLNVYPAASLVYYVRNSTPVYLIDPNAEMIQGLKNITIFREPAGTGVPKLVNQLMKSN
jgi:NAD-dependent deacetylase